MKRVLLAVAMLLGLASVSDAAPPLDAAQPSLLVGQWRGPEGRVLSFYEERWTSPWAYRGRFTSYGLYSNATGMYNVSYTPAQVGPAYLNMTGDDGKQVNWEAHGRSQQAGPFHAWA